MRPSSPRSLGRWLSWWLACQTFAGLGIVCVGVYVATSYSLAARQRDELAQQEEVVRHLFSEMTRSHEMAGLTHKLDDFFIGHSDLSLTLRTADGSQIYASAESTDQDDDKVRWGRFEISSDWAPGGLLKVELKMDIGSDSLVLTRLAWTLLACAVGGSLVVTAGGFWLVRRAMSPVRELASQTARLGAAKLSQRLDGSAQAEELQPLVDQFNALLGRLESAYVEMESFNADVAHELRTPLATLIGECELAIGGRSSARELREVLGSNLEELHRLTAIVNAMLFLSQAARGAKARRTAVASLAKLAAEVVEFHDAALMDSDLKVTIVGEAAGYFDAPLLRQALSNLLANATRFASPGSTIEMQIQPGLEGAVELTVTNEGALIDPVHLPRLFDRFYRVDPAREHGDLNHGLGLSIVAAIARMHGGSTHARSNGGRTSIGFNVAAT